MTSDATHECPNCHETVPVDEAACPACGLLQQPEPCAKHPDRQGAGVCVICGRALCDECNQGEDAYFRCEDHAPVEIVAGWAQVYTTNDDVEADLIRDNLQADGIDAQVLSQKDHFSFTVDLGDLARVRVLVPAYEYEEARRAIESHQASPGAEVTFACPACGEAYEPGETTCASCGEPLPGVASAG